MTREARRTGRPCTVCAHAERDKIDQALLNPRASVPDISRSFAVSEDALLRHRRSHMPRAAVRAAVEAHEVAESMRAASLTDQAALLRDRALALLSRAERAGDLGAAVRAIREARECVGMLARLTGEGGPDLRVSVDLLGAPQWLAVQSAILRALEAHPAARSDVVRALEAVQ